MAKVSKNIKKLRNDKELTQDALAEKINVTRQTISSWENGRTQPDIDMLELLANALQVGIEEIIYGEKRNVGLEPAKSDRRKAMNIAFATLGSLLTATGLIIILVSLIEEIPEFLLVVLSYCPLLLGGAIAAWAYVKKKNSIGWSEGSSVAWVAGFAATFYLVIMMHEVSLSDTLAWSGLALMILPVAFIMKSVFPLTVYYIIATCITSFTSFGNKEPVPIITGIVLYLIGLFHFKRTAAKDYRRIYTVWLVTVSGIIMLSSVCSLNSEAALLIILSGICTALYAADKGGDFAYPFRYIAVPGAAIIFTLLSYNIDYWVGSSEPELAPFASVIIIAIGICFGRKSLAKDKLKIAFISLTALTSLICTLYSFFRKEITSETAEIIINVFSTAIALAASIIIIVAGIKKAKILTVNLGLIMLCAIIFLILIAGVYDIIVCGIACIAMGIALLLINFKLSKAFKAKEVKQDA